MREKIILTVVVLIGFGAIALFFMPKIFSKMGSDLTDTQKFSGRMSTLILDKPECVQFKTKMLELGKNAHGMDGAFTTAIIATKNAANKAECGKLY